MKIYYDGEKTKEVNDKIWEKYGNQEKKWAEHGYNVSELSGCELKCFCNRTGIVQKHSQKDVGFLVFGIVAETIVMGIYPEDERQCEGNLNELVWGHMDAFEKHMFPIEGKATAKRIFKGSDIPEVWVRQLSYYMTMVGAKKGWLYLLDIFTRQLSAFCVEMTPDDHLNVIETTMDKVGRFDKARQTKDTTDLTINSKEYELCSYKNECVRRLECKIKAKELKKS